MNNSINSQLRIRNNCNPFGCNPNLMVEDWSLDMIGADGTYGVLSNSPRIKKVSVYGAHGEEFGNFYGTGGCKDDCKGLFPNNAVLEKACKKTCELECNRKTKCPESYKPTRSSVCVKAGLSADCTQSDGFEPSPSTGSGIGETATTTESSGASGKGMSTGAKVGITLVVLGVLGAGAYFMFRKK